MTSRTRLDALHDDVRFSHQRVDGGTEKFEYDDNYYTVTVITAAQGAVALLGYSGTGVLIDHRTSGDVETIVKYAIGLVDLAARVNPNVDIRDVVR